MSEFLSWTLVFMSVLFISYWLISYLFLKLGFYYNVGVGTIEFFRLWLKPLFLINFFWFVIIETVFSLVYWTPFIVFKGIQFFYMTTLMINRFHARNNSFLYWVIFSLLIYCVVMIPYFLLQNKLSYYFKRTIFTKLASSFNAQKSKFIKQSGGLVIDQNVLTQIAAKDQNLKDWVTQSLQDFSTSNGNENKRFSVQMTSTDHMSWEVNNIKVDFFESLIEFKGGEKYAIEDGEPKYKTIISKELFDGIAVFVENAFEDTWKPTVFETERSFNEKEQKNRIIHKQNFFIRIYNDIVFKTRATKEIAAYNNTILQQYVTPEKLNLKTDSLFQYIICDKKNLYLFIHTDLENTAFDLNMNIPVKKSMELFNQDLTLVHSAIGEIQLVLKFLEENNNNYIEQVA